MPVLPARVGAGGGAGAAPPAAPEHPAHQPQGPLSQGKTFKYFTSQGSFCNVTSYRVPTAQGKQDKWSKEVSVRENRKFGNFAKTQGI